MRKTHGCSFSVAEFDQLLSECPKHLKNILTVGYWTGMRKSEITDLTWDKVFMKVRMIRLSSDDTKEGKAKSIPMAITGHAITDMNQRYDVVEDSDKLEAIRKLEAHRNAMVIPAIVDQSVDFGVFELDKLFNS